MKYEINQEAIKDLSIADLSALITLLKLYPNVTTDAGIKLKHLQNELDTRMDNIFLP